MYDTRCKAVAKRLGGFFVSSTKKRIVPKHHELSFSCRDVNPSCSLLWQMTFPTHAYENTNLTRYSTSSHRVNG